jgi:two-component sensor histidine kinase
LEVNSKYEEFTGISANRAIGSLASQLYGMGEPPFLSQYAQVAQTGKPLIFETYFSPLDRHYRISAFSPQKGQFATVFDDITERTKMQKELSDAIDEKNAFLRELQHRIKNSFATIASMISMEMDRNLPSEASELLKNLQARMITMAELYGLLYEKGISHEVNTETFIRRIIGFLSDAYLPIDKRIAIHVSIEDFPLQVKIASSLGIIINELCINAIKHAFPNGRKGTICIEITREGGMGKLRVCDDGIGVPETFSRKDVAMHGFQLVLLLVRQIQGNIDIVRKSGGLELVLDFPVAQ